MVSLTNYVEDIENDNSERPNLDTNFRYDAYDLANLWNYLHEKLGQNLSDKNVTDFDVLKALSLGNKDIQAAPMSSHLIGAQARKHHDVITVGLPPGVGMALGADQKKGVLYVFNEKEFFDTKTALTKE